MKRMNTSIELLPNTGNQELTDKPIQSQSNSQPFLLGPESTSTMCPFCKSPIQTDVRFYSTTRTHIAAAKCAVICCCLLPYVLKSARDTVHYCPKCCKYFGSYNK